MAAVPLTVFLLDYCIRYPTITLTDVAANELEVRDSVAMPHIACQIQQVGTQAWTTEIGMSPSALHFAAFEIPQVISSIERDFEPQSPAVAVAAKETATKEKVKVQMGSQLGQLG